MSHEPASHGLDEKHRQQRRNRDDCSECHDGAWIHVGRMTGGQVFAALPICPPLDRRDRGQVDADDEAARHHDGSASALGAREAEWIHSVDCQLRRAMPPIVDGKSDDGNG